MTVKTTASSEDMVMWQQMKDENGDYMMPEPAIFIRIYSDVISLEQENNSINVSRDKKNVNELIKALKAALAD